MGRSQRDLVNYNFSKGFITEVGPLGSPENACSDISNIRIDQEGTAQVRGGLVMDYKDDKIVMATGNKIPGQDVTKMDSIHYWEKPNGYDFSLIVTQVGQKIFCNKVDPSKINGNPIPVEVIGNYTGGWKRTSNILPLRFGNTFTKQEADAHRVRSKQIGDTLYLYSPDMGVIYLRYLPDGDKDYAPYKDVPSNLTTKNETITAVFVPLTFRDFRGLSEDIFFTERPSDITRTHTYNLINNGWRQDRIAAFYDEQNKYPALSDRYWFGFVDSPGASFTDDTTFRPERFNAYDVPQASPKGGGRILYLGQNNKRAKNFGSDSLYPDLTFSGDPIKDDSSSSPATAIGSFAGRLWVAGLGEDYKPSVFFSQVLPTDKLEEAGGYFADIPATNSIRNFNNKEGACYQKNNPMDKDINDLVDDDGGVIAIPGLGDVHDLVPFLSGILVIASNGVWFIGGALETFSANSFAVRKVSDTGSISREGIVLTSDNLFYLSDSGIVSLEGSSDGIAVEIITDSTIRDYYLSIDLDLRKFSVGTYDGSEAKVYWTFRGGDCLVLDLTLGAFYKYHYGTYTFAGDSVYLYNKNMESKLIRIYRPGNSTSDNGSSFQTYFLVRAIDTGSKNKWYFLRETRAEEGIYYDYRPPAISEFQYAAQPRSYPIQAFLETGAKNFGDLMRDKTAFRVFSFFEATEDYNIPNVDSITSGVDITVKLSVDRAVARNPSGCTIQGKWEWASSPSRGKFTKKYPAYKVPPYEPFAVPNPAKTFTLSRYDPVIPMEDWIYPYEKNDLTVDVVSTRTRVRGSGKVLSLRYENEIGKGFHLLGWATTIIAVSRP